MAQFLISLHLKSLGKSMNFHQPFFFFIKRIVFYFKDYEDHSIFRIPNKVFSICQCAFSCNSLVWFQVRWVWVLNYLLLKGILAVMQDVSLSKTSLRMKESIIYNNYQSLKWYMPLGLSSVNSTFTLSFLNFSDPKFRHISPIYLTLWWLPTDYSMTSQFLR